MEGTLGWTREEDGAVEGESPVRVALQRAAGVALALTLDAMAFVLLFVLGVFVEPNVFGSVTVVAALGFPLLQVLVLGPSIAMVDLVRPEIARGVMWGGVGVFALWISMPLLLFVAVVLSLL